MPVPISTLPAAGCMTRSAPPQGLQFSGAERRTFIYGDRLDAHSTEWRTVFHFEGGHPSRVLSVLPPTPNWPVCRKSAITQGPVDSECQCRLWDRFPAQ